MEGILYDIHVAETTMSVKKISNDKTVRRSYYDYIFEKHHTTRKQFERSIKWYAAHQKKMDIIYANVKERVEKFKVDVDNYVYHPEAKDIEESRMFDTIEIFKFEKRYVFDYCPSKDSLAFEIADRNYFALADKFILTFLMKVRNLDDTETALQNSKNFLTITYSNGKKKTMTGKIICGNKWYRYTFKMPVNDSIVPVKISGNLFNGDDMVRSLRIDSAKLVRIYNEDKYPLSDSIKTVLGINIEPKEAIKVPENQQVIAEPPMEFENARRPMLQDRLERSELKRKIIKKSDMKTKN